MILGILASAIRAANPALSYDPYFDKVTALLHLDGAEGSTTITDVTGRVWEAYSGAKLGTANPKFGTAMLDLVGQVSGEANTTRIFSEAKNHTFGFRDFTVELFASQNVNTTSRAGVLACVDYAENESATDWRSWAIAIDYSGRPYARVSNNGNGYKTIGSPDGVSLGGYVHYALVRKGDLVRLFVDGVKKGEVAFSGSMWASSLGITLGSWATAKSEAFQGKIDEFRITDGVARYWDTFTPPTKAFYNTGAPKPTPEVANRKVGAGRTFSRDSFITLATDELRGYMPGPLTFLVDFTPSALPFNSETMRLVSANYDYYVTPSTSWSDGDLYRRVGLFLRDGVSEGRQVSLDGATISPSRIRVFITYDAGATAQPSAGNLQAWLNGKNVLNATSLPPSMPNVIGARDNPPAKSGSNNTAFDGTIRAVAFWNRVLSQSEIEAISAASDYAPADYSGLIHAWLPAYISGTSLSNEVQGAPGATLVKI